MHAQSIAPFVCQIGPSLQKTEALDEDGFSIVTSKKSARQRRLKHHNIGSISNPLMPSMEPRQIHEHVNRHIMRLKSLENITAFINSIDMSHVSEMVCFGLGNLALINSQIQLAFLQLIVSRRLVKFRSIRIYDPAIPQEQRELLIKEYGFEWIDQNTKGRHLAQTGTLVFMPHCPCQLYENLLATNLVHQLGNLILLGNDIKTYVDKSESAACNVSSIKGAFAVLDKRIRLKLQLKDSRDDDIMLALSDLTWHTWPH